MKNISKALFFALAVSSVLTLSCSKTEPVAPAEPAVAPKSSVSASAENIPTSSLSGGEISGLSETANVLVRADGTRLVFDNDDALVSWANTQPLKMRKFIINKLDSIKILQKFATDNNLIDDLQATEQYYIDTYGQPTGEGATSNGFTATSNFVGVGLIFSNTGCGGNSLNVLVPFLPSFFWMNNRGSSYVTVGLKTFCTRTWFRGRKYWTIEIPIGCGNFPPPFNDNTMSCF